MRVGARHPIGDNPLRSRADLVQALVDLSAPLRPCFSPGGARVSIDASAASFDRAAADLEGFARPLWGLAPALAAGDAAADWAALYRAGLASGTDPDHPEYWGAPRAHDQRLVEIATLAVALCLAPDQLWHPLGAAERERVLAYLDAARAQPCFDNNWHFFPILIDMAVRRLGGAGDEARVAAAFARIDQFHLGDGWYRDGEAPRVDHYNGFALHFYGLIHARLGGGDAARSEMSRARARAFAPHFARWFASDGAMLPFGRSLCYRFAGAAFWGACAFGGVEALPWGVMKGLYLRHLRWWALQPIARADGLLSVGYAYPQAQMAEAYNSPASPYWAFKAFLPLALPESHPFWAVEEVALPEEGEAFVRQEPPGMLVRHEPDHVVALCGGQSHSGIRSGPEKYAKFAYSSRYAFSVESDFRNFEAGAYDSMLALADGDGNWRVRETCEETAFLDDVLLATWRPWRDVRVETWLYWHAPWHIRVHRIVTPRPLQTIEGGYCVGRPDGTAPFGTAAPGRACVETGTDFSGIADIGGSGRVARVHMTGPNTNLIHPRALVPQLGARSGAGTHVLATAVLASPDVGACRLAWGTPPPLRMLPRW